MSYLFRCWVAGSYCQALFRSSPTLGSSETPEHTLRYSLEKVVLEDEFLPNAPWEGCVIVARIIAQLESDMDLDSSVGREYRCRHLSEVWWGGSHQDGPESTRAGKARTRRMSTIDRYWASLVKIFNFATLEIVQVNMGV